MADKIRILLIGPYPPPIGGSRVLFKQLVDGLRDYDGVDIQVVKISELQFSSLRSWMALLSEIVLIVWHIPRNKVISLHSTAPQALILGPIIWGMSNFFQKKTLFRKFGGIFDQEYERFPRIARFLIRRTVLRMDLLLFESKALVAYFSALTTSPVIWYPNSRPLPDDFAELAHMAVSQGAQRFVFVGHVKPSKGVLEIVEAMRRLNTDVVLDVYGPLRDGLEEATFEHTAVSYRGALSPDEVMDVLKTYDVLLLPTYHRGEGYPGVILEAYCCGLPVITTNWNAIPEIVDETSGILIEPQDTEQLVEAISCLMNDTDKFVRLRQGALEKAKAFSAETWAEKFVESCESLLYSKSGN